MTGQIETHATLEGFFSQLLSEAIEAEGLALNDACVTYVINLCREFARHEALHGCERAGESGTPALVWLYERAQTTDRGLRFHAYRQLGDISLVVSGFFAPHVERERSLVGIDYYMQMGAAAYDSAASLAQPTGFGALLSELAAKFRKLVEVLARVAERTTLPVASDVIALYNRLCRNPENDDLRRRLMTQGFVPAFGLQGAQG